MGGEAGQEDMGSWELQVLLDHEDTQDLQEPREMAGFKVYRDHRDHQDHRDYEEARALQERSDLLVLAASLEGADPQVSLDRRATEAAEAGRDQKDLEAVRAVPE